jgi:asparaginyl-tRNA synthetase
LCSGGASAPQPCAEIHRFSDGNGFFWVNTPIITASDAEGAGALFRVSSLDLANLPRTPEANVDFAQDFFGREAFLTVSGQLNVAAYCLPLTKVYTFGPTFRAGNSNTSRHLAEFLDDRAGDRLCRPVGQCGIGRSAAEVRLRGVTERKTGRSRFLRRADREGLVAKREGIVGSEFVHMDYGERYLTEKYAKKPVIVMNYPRPSRRSTCG